MKRDAHIDRMRKDLESRLEKEEKMATLKKHYARYGDKVFKIIKNSANTKNGLGKILEMLDIRLKDQTENDVHMAIINWLNTYGERRFVELYNRAHKTFHKSKSSHSSPIPGANNEELEADEEILSGSEDKEENIEEYSPEPVPEKEKTWPEVDRRSGKDRRSGNDRREDIEMVFTNKRYGGERRSGKERRKNWPPPENKTSDSE